MSTRMSRVSEMTCNIHAQAQIRPDLKRIFPVDESNLGPPALELVNNI